MGYFSTIRGEIGFDPRATWAEIRSLPDKARLFRFAVVSDDVDTPDGVLSTRTARSIEPAYDDKVKAYSLESDLADFLDVLSGRRWSGEFRIEGEEAGDIQRLFIDDKGRLTLWKARLLWPDGTTEQGR